MPIRGASLGWLAPPVTRLYRERGRRTCLQIVGRAPTRGSCQVGWSRAMFSADVLAIDPAAVSAELEQSIRDQVLGKLRRRGAVVGMSGGIDSSVVAALCARALGAEPRARAPHARARLVGRGAPPRSDGRRPPRHPHTWSRTSPRRSRGLAATRGRTRPSAPVFPDYGEGWRCKLTLPSLLEGERLNVFALTVADPDGRASVRPACRAARYLQLVAATNFKQRVRKMMEYYHADRLSYAVAGTPNRLEYDQGFFVKQGDGAADFKPIAHLYKTQVYALAEHLGVPEEIRTRPPTTDTFSLAQTQEEFYFALPYDQMDLCLYALQSRRRRPSEVARRAGAHARAGRAGLPGHRGEAPHDAATCTRHRCSSSRAEVEADDVRHRRHRSRSRDGAVAARRATTLARWSAALRHRGPDELGVYRDGRVGLGHARLSIIDLATGQQPLANEDGTLWIVFNGEIFNYVELRDELDRAAATASAPGATPRSSSTPTRTWGDGCFERFNGQFAFALWDARAATLVLARDRFGVRPLYMREHAGRLLFASEVKALFAGDPALPRAPRPASGSPRSSPSGRGRAADGLRAASRSCEPGHVRPCCRARCGDRRLLAAALSPQPPARRARRLARRAPRRRCAQALERGHAPAHAARRRAGGQLPLGRARQLARRGARPRAKAAALPDLLAALRGRRVRRERAIQRLMVERLGQPSTTRSSSTARDIAAGLPRRRPPRRAPDPAHRAGAALPALAAGARRRHQGRAHRRGRRRDVRRLRPLPRGQGAPLLGARSRLATCGRGCSSGSIPTSRARRSRSEAMARAVLRPRPRARAREPGFAPPTALARRPAALQRLFSADARAPRVGD